MQAIGLLNTIPDPGRILILCPTTLKDNWRRELLKWSIRTFNGVTIVSPTRKDLGAASQVVICNYDLFWRREIPGPFQTVICDEAHYLRNSDANRTAAALSTFKNATLKIAITGTPIVTSPYDLYAILEAAGSPLAEGYLERYVVEEEREMPNGYGGEFTYIKRRGKNQEELFSRLRETCLIRRLKKDVLPQLPPKTWQIITIPDISAKPMSEEVNLRLSAILAEEDDYRRAIFSGTGREGALDLDGHISTLRNEQSILKAPHVAKHVIDILDSGRDKIVLFAHHKEVVRILESKLAEYKPLVITGATPQNLRGGIVKEFQEGDSRVFIGSIYAAGEGITLTAASLVVFAEMDWDFSKVRQAEDRLHRIGQKDAVLIQHVVLEGGIDEMMVRAMLGKAAESRKTVGG